MTSLLSAKCLTAIVRGLTNPTVAPGQGLASSETLGHQFTATSNQTYRKPRRMARITGRTAAVVLAISAAWRYLAALRAERRQYAWNCRNMNEVQVALGQWVAASTPAAAGGRTPETRPW